MEWIYGDTIEGRAKYAAEILLTSIQEDVLFGQGSVVLRLMSAHADGLGEMDAVQSALEAMAKAPIALEVQSNG